MRGGFCFAAACKCTLFTLRKTMPTTRVDELYFRSLRFVNAPGAAGHLGSNHEQIFRRGTFRYFTPLPSMGKFGWTAVIVFGAAVAADQYWNYGYYTDGVMQTLHHIQNSFGW